MASNLKLDIAVTGSGVVYGPVGLTTPTEPIVLSQGNWPAMGLSLTYGAGNNQIKQVWQAQRTVLAGANDDLDFSGVLVNGLGETLALIAVKLLLIAINTPDGIKKLRVGPQGLAQAFQGPWGGVGATNYDEVTDWRFAILNPWDGYPIVAGATDKIRIANPSAVDVTYRILAAGLTA